MSTVRVQRWACGWIIPARWITWRVRGGANAHDDVDNETTTTTRTSETTS